MQVDEAHENVKCRLIVKALYGLFNIQIQTVKCFEQVVAAASALVPVAPLKWVRGKCCMACCDSVVAVKWNTLPFFPARASRIVVWLLELGECREQNSCGTLRLWCGSTGQEQVWNSTLLIETHFQYQIEWLAWDNVGRFPGDLPILMGRFFSLSSSLCDVALLFLLWADHVLRVVPRSWAATSNHFLWWDLQTSESKLFKFNLILLVLV